MNTVIVGAGYAGLLCAFRLARLTARPSDITVVDRSERFTQRIRLHEFLAGAEEPTVELARWLSAHKINFIRGSVDRWDPDQKQLFVDRAPLAYECLVLALGSRTDESLPGAREHGATFERCRELRAKIPEIAARNGRALVVGAGLTALEAAAELKESHPTLGVSLVYDREFAPFLSPRARAHARAVLERLGVELVTATRVEAITARGARTSTGELSADAVLLCTGFVGPEALSLFSARGLALDAKGFARVDARLRSVSHPDVMVIGDSASVLGAEAIHKSCKSAMPMGAYAADAIVAQARGRAIEPFSLRDGGVLVSLGRREAVVQGYRADGSIEGPVITGRLGVFFKEMIARYTVFSLRAESHNWLAYRWLRGKERPALAAPATARGEPRELAR
jgi:NADH dehydrogenase